MCIFSYCNLIELVCYSWKMITSLYIQKHIHQKYHFCCGIFRYKCFLFMQSKILFFQIIERVNRSFSRSSSVTVSSFTAVIEKEMALYDTEDIVTKVHKPEKVVKPMESFVIYTVSTKVDIQLSFMVFSSINIASI